MDPKAPVVLSIVIVNFETPDYVFQCIHSIYEFPPKCAYEIVLIDNGSKDDSLSLIRGAFPEILCIETGANLGFSGANNLGINNARGEYILLLNSDTKIIDSSLNGLLEHMMANPSLGAVGPKQFDGRGLLQLSWGDFPTLISELSRKVLHRRLSINDMKIREYLEDKFSDNSDVDWVSGSCLLARKSALRDAGLLDEHYFMYFEDIDLCRQIKEKGWKICYVPDCKIIHFGGVSAKKNILRVLVEYRKSQIYFTKKYYGVPGIIVLKTLLFCKYMSYFFKDGLSFIWLKSFGKDTNEAFAKLLLAKKSIELVFGRSTV